MDEEVKKMFQMWSEILGSTPAELEQEYIEIEKEMKEQHSDDTPEVLRNRALMRQQAMYSKQFKSNAKEFDVVLLGAGGMYDPYKTERKDATEKGFVDNEDRPIFLVKGLSGNGKTETEVQKKFLFRQRKMTKVVLEECMEHLN